jgi:hypothetical protein
VLPSIKQLFATLPFTATQAALLMLKSFNPMTKSLGKLYYYTSFHAFPQLNGIQIVKAFLASAIISLILSFGLLLDKIKVHWYNKKWNRKAQQEHIFYLKLVHTIESLLHTSSDQQLVASIALLLAINHQACTITAYHYNLVCTMLLMGIITHLNALISIPDFLYKGKLVGFYRFAGILAQLVLSGIAFSARDTKGFPSVPSTLAIMPAACFENMHALKDFGFADAVSLYQNITTSSANSTLNTTQLISNIEHATSGTTGVGEYATLVVFMLFAIFVLLFDFVEAIFTKSLKNSIGLRWSSIFFSAASIIASIIIIFIAMTRYNNLRDGMEVPQWYDAASQDEWTYSQILPILLTGSGSIAILKAIGGEFAFSWLRYESVNIDIESFSGQRGRRYEELLAKDANQFIQLKSDLEGHGADTAYSSLMTDANKMGFNAPWSSEF